MRLALACLVALCLIAQSGPARYPIVKNGKVGFIDQNGNEVIAPRFAPIADMAHFEEGLAPVVTADGAGYIDPSGQFVIGPSKDWGQPQQFHEGIACLLTWKTDGTRNIPTFIDRKGNVVLSGNDLDEQTYFSEGLMPMPGPDRKRGYVDHSFGWKIEPHYDWAGPFANGLAEIQSGSKYGYIDKTGQVMVAPKYDMSWAFRDGLARVRIDTPTAEKNMTMEGPRTVMRERYGFVGRDGREAIPLQFSWATDFAEDHALAKPEGSTLAAVIDKRGNLLHEPRFESASEFSEGLAAVSTRGRWGYVHPDGSWAIEPRFTSADRFWQGLARVAWDGRWGYIDRTGHVVWTSAPPVPIP